MNPDRLKGQYYKGAPTTLNNQLDDAFQGERGPGAKPSLVDRRDIKGIISPVYDYQYAAPCSAWAYNALAESGFPDVFIIPVQADQTAVTEETFQTPYDYVRVDQTFQREVKRQTGAEENNEVFLESDIVQSQLPFLQYAFKEKREAIKIAPIAVSADQTLKSFAIDLKEVAVDLDRSYRIVVPTNLVEYGREYNFVPFTQDKLEKLNALDEESLGRIKDNDPLGLLEHVSAHHLSMTNYLGVVLALLMINPSTVNVEQYYTTNDIDGETNTVVSFAAITLE